MNIKIFIGIIFSCFYSLLVAQNQSVTIKIFDSDSIKVENILAAFISEEGLISFHDFKEFITIKSDIDVNRVYAFGPNENFADLNPFFSFDNRNVYLLNSLLNENKPSADENKEMEYVGLIDSLPANYEIIEVKALKQAKLKRSGFNVQKVTMPETFIDEEKLNAKYVSKKSDDIVTSSKATFNNSAIYYGVKESALTLNVKNYLSKIAIMLLNDTKLILTMNAYTDANEELVNSNEIAEKRAENIIDFIMEKGVPFNQLRVNIKGVADLVNGCYPNIVCSEAEHEENRQVQLRIIEN